MIAACRMEPCERDYQRIGSGQSHSRSPRSRPYLQSRPYRRFHPSRPTGSLKMLLREWGSTTTPKATASVASQRTQNLRILKARTFRYAPAAGKMLAFLRTIISARCVVDNVEVGEWVIVLVPGWPGIPQGAHLVTKAEGDDGCYGVGLSKRLITARHFTGYDTAVLRVRDLPELTVRDERVLCDCGSRANWGDYLCEACRNG